MDECDKSSVVNIQNIDNKIKQINRLLNDILTITKSNCINKNYNMSPQNINSDPKKTDKTTDNILPQNIYPDSYKKTTDKQTTDKQTTDNYRGSIQIVVKRGEDGILHVRGYVEGEKDPSLLLSIDISTKTIDVIKIPNVVSMCILYNVIDYLLSNYEGDIIYNNLHAWFIIIEKRVYNFNNYEGLFEDIESTGVKRMKINLNDFYRRFKSLCVSKHYNVLELNKLNIVKKNDMGGGVYKVESFFEGKEAKTIQLFVINDHKTIQISKITPTLYDMCMLYNTIKHLRETNTIQSELEFSDWTINIFKEPLTNQMFTHFNQTGNVFIINDHILKAKLNDFYNHYQKSCEIKRLDENMGGSIKKKRRYKKSSKRKSSKRKSLKRKSLKKKKSTKRKKRKRKTKRMR